MQLQTFADIKAALHEHFVPPTTMKEAYNLDRMIALMKLLGDPQNQLKIIHVAGTSGKTSTCYYLSALLAATGKKVGLTVSPHIDEINERVQINLEPLDEKQFTAYFSEFTAIEGVTDLRPSYFEVIVAFAYWVFQKEAVDYAIIEVGLGGLGDATNVISREDKVCVITDIGIDHIQVLGDTVAKIANQKAGIIKLRNQVVTSRQSPEIMQVIEQNVRAQQGSLEIVDDQNLPIKTDLPRFQRRNWRLAYAVVQAIATRDDLPRLDQATLHQTTMVVVPARMEVRTFQDKTIILDGSHNQQKLQTLMRAVKEKYPHQTVAVLTAFISSRADQLTSALEEVRSISDTLIITEFTTGQDFLHEAIPAKEVAAVATTVGFTHVVVESSPQVALQKLLDQDVDVYLVTGSLYLQSHIRPFLSE